MKKILIISPHFPPSNLTAVHRARLFANHLTEFDWEPVILTVHEDYYEEKLDWNLSKLLPENLRVEKVKAMRTTRPRLIGDIGLRAFRSVYMRAKQIIENEKVDFLYITIPSFYGALWGRWLHKTTNIRYGIDYIDPWVHDFPGNGSLFSRAWLATKISSFLEPIAVKNASLITGVAEKYYQGVIERNPHLKEQSEFLAMPYGGEQSDNEVAARMGLKSYLFEKKSDKIQLVYAGAMLPKAYDVLEEIFKAIGSERSSFANLEIHFIGTGKTPNDFNGYNIRPMAEKYGLWQDIVFEYPARIPYLDVLIHLNAADGVFVLGSTEPHYTPSKIYQAVLAKKPVLAILHAASTAVKIIEQTNAGIVLSFNGESDLSKVSSEFKNQYGRYKKFMASYDFSRVDWSYFNEYSARELTRKLVEKLDGIVA